MKALNIPDAAAGAAETVKTHALTASTLPEAPRLLPPQRQLSPGRVRVFPGSAPLRACLLSLPLKYLSGASEGASGLRAHPLLPPPVQKSARANLKLVESSLQMPMMPAINSSSKLLSSAKFLAARLQHRRSQSHRVRYSNTSANVVFMTSPYRWCC